ncbi:unnamed protein product [Peronospora destructor]|uniref:Uncharacterized protein n=1 Tax=Peronospora destructor TaxID=86335 RepID=A0AAV0U0T4_9STRA|nr:unnamed protein product [Peronospora destructor]
MRIVLDHETQNLTALKKKNERASLDLQAEPCLCCIIRDEERTMAEGKAQVMVAQHVSWNGNKIKAQKATSGEGNSAAFLKTKRDSDYDEKKIRVKAALMQTIPLVIDQ